MPDDVKVRKTWTRSMHIQPSEQVEVGGGSGKPIVLKPFKRTTAIIRRSTPYLLKYGRFDVVCPLRHVDATDL